MVKPIPISKRCNGKHGCGQTLPISEFNKHPNGHYQSMCKKCHSAYNKTRRGKMQSNEHESAFVQECYKRGIFAALGVTSQRHAWTDVIAWGCVRIEVKHGEAYHETGYNFRGTLRQSKNGFDADIVVLIAGNDYYFFPADHAIFLRTDGKRKQAVAWHKGRKPTGRAYRWGTPLTDEIMAAHKNGWHMIEMVKSRKVKALQETALKAA